LQKTLFSQKKAKVGEPTQGERKLSALGKERKKQQNSDISPIEKKNGPW